MNKDILRYAAAILIGIVIWIAASVYHTKTKKVFLEGEVLEEILLPPLEPNLDTEIYELLDNIS